MPKCRQEEEMKYWMFTTWPRPSTRTPAPWVIQFTIYENSSLVIITILSICLIYVWVKRRRFLKKNAFLLYDLFGHAIAQEPLP